MELELSGCLLTVRCELFEESHRFKQEIAKNLVPWLKDYFRQEGSSAHSIPELIDKWNECKLELELFFNLMTLSIVL